MKLTLRPEWRLWPFASFLGVLDLKTGVTVALIFALLNKVAGIYGLIAVLTGAGGTFPQISLYIYSALALVGLVWGLKVVNAEDPRRTLYVAHLFFADHILSTAWTVFFAVVWWVYTPHDGKRQANSAAQEEMMKAIHKVGSGNMTEAERVDAARMIWNKEKHTAALVITLSWLAKIYFALLLYSYATHLRRNSYRSLPFSRSNAHATSSHLNAFPDEEDEEDLEDDAYHMLSRPRSANHPISSNRPKPDPTFDVVSAPGRERRPKNGSGRSPPKQIEMYTHSSKPKALDADLEEVLFDEDELRAKIHTKMGTEESASGSSPSDEW